MYTRFRLENIKERDHLRPSQEWLDNINPLNAELNPICHLLALLEAHHILHVSKIRVKIYLK